MQAPRLYPDPPHLAAAVYCDSLSEREVFWRLCRAVRALGGDPAGLVQVFPEGTDFEWLTDLGTGSEEVEASGQRFWDLVEGKVPGLSALRAGFHADPVGLVVVSYELRERSENRHPINAHISAGALGIPEHLWQPGDRLAAGRTAHWIRSCLRRACRDVRPLYGALSEEETLPAPADLSRLRSQDLYIDDRVLASDTDLEQDMMNYYGPDRIERWDSGIFCTSWELTYPEKVFSKAVAAETRWPSARLAQAISLMTE